MFRLRYKKNNFQLRRGLGLILARAFISIPMLCVHVPAGTALVRLCRVHVPVGTALTRLCRVHVPVGTALARLCSVHVPVGTALARPCICTGSSNISLLAHATNTKISKTHWCKFFYTQNISYGCSLAESHRDLFNEYPEHIFWHIINIIILTCPIKT